MLPNNVLVNKKIRHPQLPCEKKKNALESLECHRSMSRTNETIFLSFPRSILNMVPSTPMICPSPFPECFRLLLGNSSPSLWLVLTPSEKKKKKQWYKQVVNSLEGRATPSPFLRVCDPMGYSLQVQTDMKKSSQLDFEVKEVVYWYKVNQAHLKSRLAWCVDHAKFWWELSE